MEAAIVHTAFYQGEAGPGGDFQIACTCGVTATDEDPDTARAVWVEHLNYTAWPVV